MMPAAMSLEQSGMVVDMRVYDYWGGRVSSVAGLGMVVGVQRDDRSYAGASSAKSSRQKKAVQI